MTMVSCYMMILSTIICRAVIISYLAYLSLQDFSNKRVNASEVYIAAILCLFTLSNAYTLLLTIAILLLLYTARDKIGEADIILIVSLTATISVSLIPYWILSLGICNLALHNYLDNPHIPMIPSITASYILINFLNIVIR